MEKLEADSRKGQGSDRHVGFVVFSDDWGRHPSSCEHIFRHLVSEYRVIWVNTIGFRAPRLTVADLKRSFEIIRSWIFRTNADDHGLQADNLEIVTPIVIPLPGVAACDAFNSWSMSRPVNKALTKYPEMKMYLVSSLPNVGGVFQRFPELLKLYYCVDDFVQWPGAKPSVVNRMEQDLISHCNGAVITSKNLGVKYHQSKIKPTLLNHGVDYRHFSVGQSSISQSASGAAVIGFFGEIREWFAVDLILEAAKVHPEWTIVLIGRVQTDVSELEKQPNIKLHGYVAYAELPKIASTFSVGIIPYQVSALTRTISPLKCLEYLALGLPVVATSLPSLEAYGDFVVRADEPRAFTAAIENALATNSHAKFEERKDYARQNDWSNVASMFLSKVLRSE